ncbi:MAG TPA: ABC transporter permease [Candidatus Avilachnospira avistercoris]|nr:ABC transporter permease [Candidatus Avilachnospira avistercoris]
MHLMLKLLRELMTQRRLIWELGKADFRKRFVGSYFGIVWMFIQPIATVLVYFFVFQIGMKSTPPVPDAPYVIWLIPGIIPWFFFSDAISGLTGTMSEYSYLVKKMAFPVELLPAIKLLSCFFVHFCFIVIMLVVFLISGYIPEPSWIQIIYYSFAAGVLSLGLGYLTSAVNVFFKDMSQIVSIALQFGMWLVPIMYWEGLFTTDHPWMELVFKLNPFYYIVTGYRDSMLMGDFFFERPLNTLYFWGFALILCYVGLKVFMKLRPHFSDVL